MAKLLMMLLLLLLMMLLLLLLLLLLFLLWLAIHNAHASRTPMQPPGARCRVYGRVGRWAWAVENGVCIRRPAVTVSTH
jgi:hypothetical protein